MLGQEHFETEQPYVKAIQKFYHVELLNALKVANIAFIKRRGTDDFEFNAKDKEAVVSLIEDIIVPDLTPVQFHYMLNKYGLSDVIALLLPALKEEDNERWSIYKAYLEQARSYEFNKAYTMLDAIKDKFLMVNENLNLTYSHLKEMWLDAKSSIPS